MRKTLKAKSLESALARSYLQRLNNRIVRSLKIYFQTPSTQQWGTLSFTVVAPDRRTRPSWRDCYLGLSNLLRRWCKGDISDQDRALQSLVKSELDRADAGEVYTSKRAQITNYPADLPAIALFEFVRSSITDCTRPLLPNHNTRQYAALVTNLPFPWPSTRRPAECRSSQHSRFREFPNTLWRCFPEDLPWES